MHQDRSAREPLLTLKNIDAPPLIIRSGDCWGVVGSNGSGKSSLARTLTSEAELSGIERSTSLNKILCVSFENEQELLEREIYEDDSEFTERTDHGRTTLELISELASEQVDLTAIIRTLQLDHFLHTGFRLLSTGERRRLMLARALAQAPDMLVLDEPFDGLDIQFRKHFENVITTLSRTLPTVLIVNRISHLGDHITHLAFISQGGIVMAGPRQEIEQSPLWGQLQAVHVEVPPQPQPPPGFQPYVALQEEPIIAMKDVCVGYHQKPIINGLDWTVMPGEHWKISGPNGCGKSTLVNLVSGDHPQCYANDIHLFGSRRGQGESVWDIKRHMGLMSTSLHQQYRVTATAETVILSGFFDSIGVYRQVQPYQRALAAQWLEFLHMADAKGTTFQRLSFGQQRMLLIARALVKRPHLLILDEPCQGLDPVNRSLVIQLIERICRTGLAQLLYISHDPEDHISCLTHELVFSPRTDISNGEMPPYQVSQTVL